MVVLFSDAETDGVECGMGRHYFQVTELGSRGCVSPAETQKDQSSIVRETGYPAIL